MTFPCAKVKSSDIQCLPGTCDGNERADCRYKLYKESDMSPAQKGLVNAFCSTCSPGATCFAKTIAYDAKAGPTKVSDAFIAVWELSDEIVAKVQKACTGDALPGKNGDCPKAFGQCAAGIYLDALPECPK